MIFKCKNCGGNVVYSPLHGKMYCPYCEGTDSAEQSKERQGVTVCTNCGGELHVEEFASAARCPYCSSYLIFDERVEGEYTPHLILPFKVDKETVKKSLREKFKSSIFAPSDFFSDAKLDSMEGMYVPFWLYDYQAKGHYDGECTKIRTWMAGDRQFTETSVYHVVREMDVSFDKVPVDASNAMPDETMDLMEPYDYKALESFRAEYMSGFSAERYNQTADYLEYRAKTKAFQDAETMLHDSVTGYTDKKTMKDNVDLNCAEQNYALMPVWIYNYKYKGQDYRFHVNGQTGKIVGKVPIVQGKVIGYGATVFGIIFSIAMMARFLML